MPNLDLHQVIAFVDQTASFVEQFSAVLPAPVGEAAGMAHTAANIASQVVSLGEQAKTVFVDHPDVGQLEASLGALQAQNDAAFARVDGELTARIQGH